jgi:hypothetical protein
MPLFNPDKITKLISEMRRAINRLRFLKTLEPLAKVSNEHPPQPLPSREGK